MHSATVIWDGRRYSYNTSQDTVSFKQASLSTHQWIQVHVFITNLSLCLYVYVSLSPPPSPSPSLPPPSLSLSQGIAKRSGNFMIRTEKCKSVIILFANHVRMERGLGRWTPPVKKNLSKVGPSVLWQKFLATHDDYTEQNVSVLFHYLTIRSNSFKILHQSLIQWMSIIYIQKNGFFFFQILTNDKFAEMT